MSKEIYSFVRVASSCEEVFPYFFSINPLNIFKGIVFFPEAVPDIVKNISAKTGSERFIYFDDGSTALCRLLHFIPKGCFSFYIDDFISMRFTGVKTVQCSFSFIDLKYGMTQVNSQYEFKMQSAFWDLFFEVFLRRLIQKRLDMLLIQTSKELKLFIDWKLTLD